MYRSVASQKVISLSGTVTPVGMSVSTNAKGAAIVASKKATPSRRRWLPRPSPRSGRSLMRRCTRPSVLDSCHGGSAPVSLRYSTRRSASPRIEGLDTCASSRYWYPVGCFLTISACVAPVSRILCRLRTMPYNREPSSIV